MPAQDMVLNHDLVSREPEYVRRVLAETGYSPQEIERIVQSIQSRDQ